MPGLSIVFAGTPDFAVPALEAIAGSRHRVVAVYTQPDRPAGRGLKLLASPVKRRAGELGLPVFQPTTLRDEGAAGALAALAPDVLVVVAYGLILPQAILDVPRLGCLNIHASLLPRWRGAAPIQRAILAGDAETGVTIMGMEAGLDTGPMLLREAEPIGPEESAGRLHDRLAQRGAKLIVAALDQLEHGEARFTPQPTEGVTYAAKLDKSEAILDWTLSALDLARRVRAFDPWPVAETTLEGRQLRIWAARPVEASTGDARPGTILRAGGAGIEVACGQGVLNLERVQLAGGKPLPAGDFVRGRALTGRVLGQGS
ncbi:MAG: methionyl-tRNA formyltransferase [Steroidobacteraceae bacterium]